MSAPINLKVFTLHDTRYLSDIKSYTGDWPPEIYDIVRLQRCVLLRAAFLDVLTLDFSFMGRMKPRARFARPALPCILLNLWTSPSRTGKRSLKLGILGMRNTWHVLCHANRSLQNTCARKAQITCKLGSLWSTTWYIGNTSISSGFLEN